MSIYKTKKQKRLNKLRNQARLKDKKRRIKNKKRKYMLYYIFFTLILISVSTILSLTVFFKIDSIEIKSSNSNFTSQNILNKIDLHYGDNLILTDINKLTMQLLNNFPQLSKLEIKKIFPNKIKLYCYFDKPMFVLETKNNNLFGLSKSGRILKKYTNEKYCKNLIHLKIDTPTFIAPKIGQFLKLPKQEKQTLNQLINTTKKYDIKNITKIEINPNFEIIMTYDNRIKIEIKNYAQINKIISVLNEILNNFTGEYEKGRICYFEKNNTIHLIPDTNPANSN